MPETVALDRLDEWFDRLADEFLSSDGTAAFEQTAEDLDADHRRRFARETGADGAPWPQWQWRTPWAPEEHRTMEVTSRLLGSLRRGGSDHVREIGPRSLAFGTATPYARLHQDGGTIRLGVPLVHRSGRGYLPPGTQVRIPARPFLGWSQQTADAAAGHVADALVSQLKG